MRRINSKHGKEPDEKIINARQMMKILGKTETESKRGLQQMPESEESEVEIEMDIQEKVIPSLTKNPPQREQKKGEVKEPTSGPQITRLEATLCRSERLAKRNQESIDLLREVSSSNMVDQVAAATTQEEVSPGLESRDNIAARMLGSSHA